MQRTTSSLEEPRTYRVFYKQDFRPDWPFHWRVAYYGDGHWCRNDGHEHAFVTEAEAEAAGKLWIETGRVWSERVAAAAASIRRAA